MKAGTVIKRILNRLITGEEGQALPVVLILLALGGLTIAPLMTHMNAGLNATQIHREKTVEQYSGDSAIEHATWRLLYDSQFVGAMTGENPSVQYSININGMDVPVTVTRLAGLGGDTLTLDVDYVIPAGHLLEFRVIVLSDDHCHFAYDTVTYSSGLSIPTASETITYYLHNNPTPPTTDTDRQANLPMDESQPSATTLNNYDYNQGYDLSPGRKIEEYRTGELKEYQNWRTTTPYVSNTHLKGTVIVSLWGAPDGFNYDNEGGFRVFLRDYDPVLQTYSEIASTDYYVAGGQWVEGWTPTAAEGKYRILASAGDTQIEAVVALGFGYLRTLSFMYK